VTMPFAVRSLCAAAALLMYLGASPAAAMTSNDSAAYARVMRSINPHLAQYESRLYASTLLAVSRRAKVDPKLVMAVVTVESHWNARARSIHGAEGLGQLKPATARDLHVDPWSGMSNLRGVATYLHRLFALFHAAPQPLRATIAGYNAGPNAVGRDGQIPHNGQTPRYVEKVLLALGMVRSRLGIDVPAAELPAAENALAAIDRADAAFWGVRSAR